MIEKQKIEDIYAAPASESPSQTLTKEEEGELIFSNQYPDLIPSIEQLAVEAEALDNEEVTTRIEDIMQKNNIERSLGHSNAMLLADNRDRFYMKEFKIKDKTCIIWADTQYHKSNVAHKSLYTLY